MSEPSLSDVLQHPADDAPRLAYADAIAATNPARAELIRVQIEQLRSRRAGESPLARADAYTREDILLQEHRVEWSKAVLAIPGVTYAGFKRGFIELVEMSASDFLANADALYACAPILHLNLTAAKKQIAFLCSSPHLARVHSLQLSRNFLGDIEMMMLAESRYLGDLRWLDLSYNEIGRAGLNALCASANLPSLRYLEFGDNRTASPTPQIGETDWASNDVVSVSIPDVAQELEERFGKRAWLSGPFDERMFPPERDLF